MGMQTRAGENPFMLLRKLQRAVVSSGTSPAANGENALQACFSRTTEHLSAVRIELVAFDVSVGIDVHVYESGGASVNVFKTNQRRSVSSVQSAVRFSAAAI
jgi:hypothetical protein